MNVDQKKSKSSFSLVGLFFGLVFGGAGLLFVGLIVREFSENLATYRWDSVPAVIDDLPIDYPKAAPGSRKRRVFTLNAKYTYTYGGREYVGNRLGRAGGKTSDSYEKLALKRRRMLIGEVDRAFVDPKDPANAILERGSLWFGLLALFPMIFVIIGFAVLRASLGGWAGEAAGRMQRRVKPEKRGEATDRSISRVGLRRNFRCRRSANTLFHCLGAVASPSTRRPMATDTLQSDLEPCSGTRRG